MPRSFDAVAAAVPGWHADVHQNHIWLVSLYRPLKLLPVAYVGDNFEAFFKLQQPPQARPVGFVVVSDQHFDNRHHSYGFCCHMFAPLTGVTGAEGPGPSVECNFDLESASGSSLAPKL